MLGEPGDSPGAKAEVEYAVRNVAGFVLALAIGSLFVGALVALFSRC